MITVFAEPRPSRHSFFSMANTVSMVPYNWAFLRIKAYHQPIFTSTANAIAILLDFYRSGKITGKLKSFIFDNLKLGQFEHRIRKETRELNNFTRF